MPQFSQHAERPNQVFESPQETALSGVLNRNRVGQIRQEIGIIADRSYRDRLITDEAYAGYKEVAKGLEQHELSAEMLESTRRFAEKHEHRAARINRKIRSAISARIASEADEAFLMEKLVVGNMKFNEKADEVEGLIDQKIARMKKDRELYDKLAGHKMIKDIGYLKVNSELRIDFPNLENFLKMTVPERRELLKSIQEALPEAEQHAEKGRSEESLELRKKYKSRLDEAHDRRIIGNHTYRQFMSGFEKIDLEEKRYWLEEFDHQMVRYESLWRSIRSTLRGPALAEIEGKLDGVGYTKLLAEFGRLKASESARLTAEYARALEKYRNEGLIGRHTIGQFMIWHKQQELGMQYEATASLPGEMKRYEDLWADIKTLKPKQQEFLKGKIDTWGYTELRSQYLVLAGKTVPEEADPLLKIDSVEVREAIRESDEILTDQGKSKKNGLSRILDRMFSRASSSSFDATSFETQIRERTLAFHPERGKDVKGRGGDDDVDLGQIEEDAELLEEAGKGEVIAHEGFIQVESKDAKGEIHRDAQVMVNDEESLRRFFAENTRNTYRAEDDGGNDDLSLSIRGSGGSTVELDLREIRVLHEYLKHKEEEEDPRTNP